MPSANSGALPPALATLLTMEVVIMLHTPRQRAGRGARLTRLLLLGLAVAACGDAGETGDAAAGDSAQARAAGAGSADRGAGPQCPPSPAIDTTFFTDSTWSSFLGWIGQNRVRFTGPGARRNVPLEPEGTPVSMTIQSEQRTHCTRRDDVRGQTRIAGIFRVESGASAFGHTFAAGDTIFVFSHDTIGRPVLAFRNGTRVGTAPATANWRFRFCHDGHPHASAAADWRQFDRPPNGPPGEEDPGTYGWMACASGCCQFYIPPKDPEDPGDKGAGRPVNQDTVPPCKPVP
jgi:hypothetical protein